jgi:3-methyladenine DNA glycosylase/8-oxoguanine DNA glycosylase
MTVLDSLAPRPPLGVPGADAPLDPLRQRMIRLNVSWYRTGRGDPTTWIGAGAMVRAVWTPDGPATIRLAWDRPGGIAVDAWGPGADWAAATAPAMTAAGKDVDAPPDHHRLVTRAAHERPGFAAGASGDLYHSLLPTIIAQRITAREAVRQWSLLVRRLGEPAPGPFPGLLHAPSPERLAGMPTWWFHPLGIEVKRARPLIAVARLAHRLWEWASLDADAASAKLALIPGIGPWTIGMVRGPVFGDDDAVPVGDYHFPHTVSWNLAGEPRGDDARMLELLEPYRPQRGRVLRLLGLAGQRAPAFAPRRRILPMHRW